MKKTIGGALVLLAVSLSVAAQPSPRLRTLLDEQWHFQLGEWHFEQKDVPDVARSGYDDSQWRVLDLPHDWSVEEPPPHGIDGRDAMFANGIGWYRKTIKVAPEWTDCRVVLAFEGVYRNPEVFVNGQRAGRHAYGYTPFTIDLTEQVRNLAAGDPVAIAVRVDNSRQPETRWGFSGSGIYRHVWLHVFGQTHIVADGIAVATTELDARQNEATLRVETTVGSHEKNPGRMRRVTVRTTVHDLQANGAQVAQAEVSDMLVRAEQGFTATLKIPNPRPWSPESPNLYRVDAKLYGEAGELLDEYSAVTGIRTLAWSAERGLELNGASVKLNGGNVHSDNGIFGAASFDRVEEMKVKWLKNAGFNAVRAAHNPYSRAFLEACDRLGMLVIGEIFDVWGDRGKTKHDYHELWDEWHVRDLETWVRRDRHHPSLIFWSIGNEIYQSAKPEGIAIARELSQLVRALDGTRPVVMGQDAPWTGEGWKALDPIFSHLDIAGYNYALVSRDPKKQPEREPEFKVYSDPPRYLADHERVPDRIMFVSESFQYEAFANWKATMHKPYVLGDFVWTALDYLGDGTLGRPGVKGATPDPHRWRNTYCGDIDLIGWRKPASHYREIIWGGGQYPKGYQGRAVPKLYMAVLAPPPPAGWDFESDWIFHWALPPAMPSWTWPGREGKAMTVEVYSRYEAVRLYLNGRKIGDRPTTEAEEFKASFDVPYAAGNLVAVGLSDGKEAERFELKTVGAPLRLRATADRAVGKADGQDIFFVEIEALDASGAWNPHASQAIEVTVEGAGTLAALGTANTVGGKSYPEQHLALYQGRALTGIRTTRQRGEITVRVSSPSGLAPAEIRLSAE